MKIIILGAGQVGGALAEHLANEQNDIIVVDTDGDKLRALQDRLTLARLLAGARTQTYSTKPAPKTRTCSSR